MGFGMGVGYTLMLRQLVDQFAAKPGSAVSLSILMAIARILPVGFLVPLVVVWDAKLALAGFAGFWLGRTTVLVLSFSRKPE
jgi:hypothetical protein